MCDHRKSLDTLFGRGPGKSGVSVYPDHLHIRVSTFALNQPRNSIRSLAASQAALHGTTGVHITRGRAIINGCDNGLVQFGVDPPLCTGRVLSTGFFRQRVDRIVLSLVDPQALIDAVGPTSG